MNRDAILTDKPKHPDYYKWVEMDENNHPPECVICEFKHPEYGNVTGSVVIYQPQRDNGYTQSKWVFPDGGSEADISLNEFTHYRRISY